MGREKVMGTSVYRTFLLRTGGFSVSDYIQKFTVRDLALIAFGLWLYKLVLFLSFYLIRFVDEMSDEIQDRPLLTQGCLIIIGIY